MQTPHHQNKNKNPASTICLPCTFEAFKYFCKKMSVFILSFDNTRCRKWVMWRLDGFIGVTEALFLNVLFPSERTCFSSTSASVLTFHFVTIVCPPALNCTVIRFGSGLKFYFTRGCLCVQMTISLFQKNEQNLPKHEFIHYFTAVALTKEEGGNLTLF